MEGDGGAPAGGRSGRLGPRADMGHRAGDHPPQPSSSPRPLGDVGGVGLHQPGELHLASMPHSPHHHVVLAMHQQHRHPHGPPPVPYHMQPQPQPQLHSLLPHPTPMLPSPLLHHAQQLGGGHHSLHESSAMALHHNAEGDPSINPRMSHLHESQSGLSSSGPLQLHDGLTDSHPAPHHQVTLMHHQQHHQHQQHLDTSSTSSPLLYSGPQSLSFSGFASAPQQYGLMYSPYAPHMPHHLHHPQQMAHHQELPTGMVGPEDEQGSETTTTSTPSLGVDEGEESIGKDGTRFVPLRQREQIARWAYKTWFRVRPGHKEVKDKWWALYYRKLLPQYHLRDNYLGRKINQWIEEDLAPLKLSSPEQFTVKAQGRPGRKPKLRINADGTPMKRRKPNSSKEGSLPAYANVEMVRPTSRDEFVLKLAECCVDGSVDWTPDVLDSAVQWFKQNRNQIMENIPSITKAGKRKKEQSTFDTHTSKRYQMDSPKHTPNLPEGMEIHCDTTWIKSDIIKTANAYIIRVDLPGVIPESDVVIQTDGNKLLIKGERKERQAFEPGDERSQVPLVIQRPVGPFTFEVILPQDADFSHTEQTYENGVLSVKFTLREPSTPQWRSLRGPPSRE